MKKLFIIMFLSFFLLNIGNLSAYNNSEKLAADFLSYKDIINAQENAINYELDKKITRREMAKVTLNLSGKLVEDKCSGKFSDITELDWGCKYAESGLKYNYFAKNLTFNPNNNISKIEALKVIMKARGIEKIETTDWREGYVIAAKKYGLLESSFTDYDIQAKRGWIFLIGQRSIEYSKTDEDINLIIDLLNI
ncbi:MAG: hypothetical protein Q9M94_06190 [Candidatus Gracilibacteria bacterium]|nr:hypothetical protein [Candidatus Gracilibacteria bacterium]MDQ7023503.1 hypothetical protein [Candidatus Gracilibacteria bacterium]